MKKIILFAAIIAFSITAFADNGYKTTPSGVRYKMFNSNTGTKIAQGNIVRLNFTMRNGKDSIVFSTSMSGTPADWKIDPPKFKGDFMEGLTMLSEGDSASFLMTADSVYKGMQMPSFCKTGQDVRLDVKIIKIYTMDQYNAMQQQQAAKEQTSDDSTLQAYFKKNNITNAQKTADGLYYVITQAGTGAKPNAGQKVSVNYTGKFLDGKVFDSSLKPGRTPLEFAVGKGQLIKGWDEGISLLNVGSKATLYLPSTLAYGSRGISNVIPPNSVLIFDVELISIAKPHTPAVDDSIIQDYIKKNNLTNVQKTQDGLYYVVTTQGTGAKPTNGQTVTVNYTGKFLDGKVFDSSLNPGRKPFDFKLGAGQVIKGWDEGIALLNIGSKATLLIPSQLAYGESGNQGIPGDTVLLFDVELINAK